MAERVCGVCGWVPSGHESWCQDDQQARTVTEGAGMTHDQAVGRQSVLDVLVDDDDRETVWTADILRAQRYVSELEAEIKRLRTAQDDQQERAVVSKDRTALALAVLAEVEDWRRICLSYGGTNFCAETVLGACDRMLTHARAATSQAVAAERPGEQ